MKRSKEIHVTGLGFPEGPVALPDGSVAFVDLLHAKVRTFKDGSVRELATLPGAPNGMRLGPDGALYVCNNGGLAPESLEKLHFAEPMISGCIQRLELDGRWENFADQLPGAKPSRPNDLIFTPEGGIVFTDPQNWEVLGADDAAYHGGQLLAAGQDRKVHALAKMTGFPNGLVFHPDGSLIVGITMEHRLLRFDWSGGSVGAMTEWVRLDDRFKDGVKPAIVVAALAEDVDAEPTTGRSVRDALRSRKCQYDLAAAIARRRAGPRQPQPGALGQPL